MDKRDILYVDDELDNLVVFEAAFEEEFNVYTANSGAAGLKLMEDRLFPVVITDQRMPGMSGSQFLEAIRARHPQTKRLMLTGYADSRAMLEAINQGQVYYFIQKPWESGFVRAVLLRSIEAYDMSMSNASLKERMLLMDRCATLGRSAAELAHEIGNQLCMLPLIEFIEDNYKDHEELMQLTGFTRNTYQRLVGLVNEIKAFVRCERDVPADHKIRLADVVQEVVDFLRHDRTLSAVELSLDLPVNPGVKASGAKLQQVLINLLKNAADALRGRSGARVAVSLVSDAQSAVLSVSDNGPGIPPEIADRIWEPFFTTKGSSGTGLGLDVARSIIESYQGTIHCETAVGEGARFVIRLPLAEAAGGAAPQPAAELRPANQVVIPMAWEPGQAAIDMMSMTKSS